MATVEAPIKLQPMTGTYSKPIVTIDITQRDALSQQVIRQTVQVDALAIGCDEEYESAADILKDVKRLDKEIEEFFKPAVKSAHQLHKDIKADENLLRDPLKKLLDKLGRSMGKYQADLERQRKIEREMLLEQQRKEAQAAAAELAEGLAENGDIEAAVGVLEQAEKIQPEVNCESIAPKVRGTAVRTTWHFVIENVDLIPRKYMIPNVAMLNAEAQACQENTNIPGGRAESETKVSARV